MGKSLAIIFLLLTVNSVTNAGDNTATPVMVGAVEDLDACTGLGVVSGLDPEGDAFLAVRAAANANAKMLDKLPA